jgi:hypothetical protein
MGFPVTENFRYSNELFETAEIERILAKRPDAEQLIAFISLSYRYIRNLPLNGLSENYAFVHCDIVSIIE